MQFIAQVYQRWRWQVLLAVALSSGLFGFFWFKPLSPPVAGKQALVVVTHENPLSYEEDSEGQASGLEHDLLTAFAEAEGLEIEFLLVPPADVLKTLQRGKAHIAAAWLSPRTQDMFKSSTPLMETRDVIVQHEAALPIDRTEKLHNRQVTAIPDSRQAEILRQLGDSITGLKINYFKKEVELDLLEKISRGEVDVALMDQAIVNLGMNFYPELQTGMALGKPRPITWLLNNNIPPDFLQAVDSFLVKAKKTGLIKRLEDRYLGHVNRLTDLDLTAYIADIETVLPKYRHLFQEAQRSSDIDWRLLAALSYQESHWNPLATSFTGVRGMMMLTEETADRLGVKNRLDPKEAIDAGGRYLAYLINQIVGTAPEPDRFWLALAAYNVGPGHFNAARSIAKQVKKNPDSWFEMKSVLPLLARPEYYENLKSGRGRGGEAVTLAENVRMYYDILQRREPAFASTGSGMMRMEGMTGMLGMSGMAGTASSLKKPTEPKQGLGLTPSNTGLKLPGVKLNATDSPSLRMP